MISIRYWLSLSLSLNELIFYGLDLIVVFSKGIVFVFFILLLLITQLLEHFIWQKVIKKQVDYFIEVRDEEILLRPLDQDEMVLPRTEEETWQVTHSGSLVYNGKNLQVQIPWSRLYCRDAKWLRENLERLPKKGWLAPDA